MILFILQAVCTFLLAVGILFTLIDLRTKFDTSFRYFGVSLVLLSGMTGIDLWVVPVVNGAEDALYWQRVYHILACAYLGLTVRYIQILTRRKDASYQRAMVFLNIVFSGLFLTDLMFRVESGAPVPTLFYDLVFVPFVIANGGLLAYFIISRLRRVATSERKVLVFHLVGFIFMLLCGVADMTVVSGAGHSLIPNYTVVGVLVFGIMASLIFTERFLGLLKEKDQTLTKLESAYRDLEQVNVLKQLGESTAIINHEIKNYMFMISGNAQILGEMEHLSQKGKDIVRNIVTSVERLTVFSDDILKMSRIQVMREKHPVNLTELVKGVVEKHFPGQRGCFSLQGMERDHFLFGDWGKLEQAFVNLFNNALEAAPDGKARIQVKVTDAQSLLLVSVEDDGEGCDKDQLENLFKAFHTTKRAKGGTGLGMSITRTVVESHGGKISAYSKNLARKGEHGLKLIMTFPVYALSMAEEAQRKYPIVLVKDGMDNLPDIIRVFQNVKVSPIIVQSADDIGDAELPPDSLTVIVSAKTMASRFTSLSQYPMLCLVSHHERNLYVLDSGRGNRPEVFSEEYVISRLLRRVSPRTRLRERQVHTLAA